MKAFRFTLQPLLDVREAMEKVLEVKHATARREFEKAQLKQRAMVACIKKVIEDVALMSGTCVSCQTVSSFLKHIERAQNAIADQSQRVAGLEAKMEKCRSDLHEAMRGRKALERLLEGEHERWRDEQRRHDQKEMDEYGRMNHAHLSTGGAGITWLERKREI